MDFRQSGPSAAHRHAKTFLHEPPSKLQSDRRRHLQRAAIAPGCPSFASPFRHSHPYFTIHQVSPTVRACKLRWYQIASLPKLPSSNKVRGFLITLQAVSRVTFLSKVIDRSQNPSKPQHGPGYQKFCSQSSNRHTFHCGKARAGAAFQSSSDASTSQCT
jgi:hypothetical protein